MGTLKYINLLLHIDIHLQRVKHMINEQSMNINVFLLFLSFVFLQIERERGGVYKIGYKEKWSQSLFIFFSLMEFLWRIFPLLRANRLYAIFNTGLKNLAPSCPRFFLSSSTRSTGFGSVCHEPCPTTNFFFSYFG